METSFLIRPATKGSIAICYLTSEALDLISEYHKIITDIGQLKELQLTLTAPWTISPISLKIDSPSWNEIDTLMRIVDNPGVLKESIVKEIEELSDLNRRSIIHISCIDSTVWWEFPTLNTRTYPIGIIAIFKHRAICTNIRVPDFFKDNNEIQSFL
jgi:hypothetical protein